jgi:predicted XRE-type DNA-binding protein
MKKQKKVINKSPKDLAKSLGLSPLTALDWEIRNQITKRIAQRLKFTDLTITRIAKLSGTSRARVTRILKADTLGISLDVLFRVLGALGDEVKLSFKKIA